MRAAVLVWGFLFVCLFAFFFCGLFVFCCYCFVLFFLEYFTFVKRSGAGVESGKPWLLLRDVLPAPGTSVTDLLKVLEEVLSQWDLVPLRGSFQMCRWSVGAPRVWGQLHPVPSWRQKWYFKASPSLQEVVVGVWGRARRPWLDLHHQKCAPWDTGAGRAAFCTSCIFIFWLYTHFRLPLGYF